MRMQLAVGMASGLALAAIGPAAAGEKAAGTKGEKEARPPITVEGRVQSTDKKKNLVTVKLASGEALNVILERQTKIIRGSKENLDIISLKPGKKVRVRYEDRDGKKVARWVLILPEEKGKKEKSKEKPEKAK